jgi:hypothetical protein
MINDLNICVIGLKAREDRWKRCVEILEAEGIEEVYHYVTVQDYQDSYKGYMTDFINMLKMFQGHDLLFFEDDFEFTKGWKKVFEKAYKDLPQEWDLLYFGANLTSPITKVTDNLVRVYGAWLMHATLLSHTFIDYILIHYLPANIRIIDEWYRKIAPTRNFYMTIPMISYQRPDYSDFVGQYVYYNIFTNKYYLQFLKSL